MSERDGFVEIDTEAQITAIIRKLQRLPDQIAAPNILKNALNDTTREIRRLMNKRAKKRYVLRDPSILTEKREGGAWIDPATNSDQTSILLSQGNMRNLMDFMTQPNSGTASAAAKVINESSMKSLEMDGLKAFVVKFKSKHTAIVQRDPTKEYKDGRGKRIEKYGKPSNGKWPDMAKIKKLLGPAVPHMLGAALNMSQEEINTVAYDVLQKHIDRQIRKTMEAR